MYLNFLQRSVLSKNRPKLDFDWSLCYGVNHLSNLSIKQSQQTHLTTNNYVVITVADNFPLTSVILV